MDPFWRSPRRLVAHGNSAVYEVGRSAGFSRALARLNAGCETRRRSYSAPLKNKWFNLLGRNCQNYETIFKDQHTKSALVYAITGFWMLAGIALALLPIGCAIPQRSTSEGISATENREVRNYEQNIADMIRALEVVKKRQERDIEVAARPVPKEIQEEADKARQTICRDPWKGSVPSIVNKSDNTGN
jgi:hypothetical protein